MKKSNFYINIWRVFEPLLLGSIANIIINYIFNPSNPDFIWSEFLVAILFAIPVTEINHRLDKVLDKKFSWTFNFWTRFKYHLSFLTLCLLFMLNVIGNLFLWVKGEGYHTFKEMFIINASVFLIAILLTLLKWTIHFYQNWRKTERDLKNSKREMLTLKKEIDKSDQLIKLNQRMSVRNLNVQEIKLAKIEFGVVWIYFGENEKGTFQGSLTSFFEKLPKYNFFQASRNIIIHREIIVAFSSSTYGKIDIKIPENFIEGDTIVVSRSKAASFRSWYYSTSTSNS